MNFLERVNAVPSPVVVFGASFIGKVVLDALAVLNIRPACFCDNDPKKQAEPFYGHGVISFETLRAAYHDAIIVVAAGRYLSEICRQLTDAGFTHVYEDSDVIGCIDFKKTPRERVENILWHLAKIGKLSQVMETSEGCLHIPRLNVVVTSRCTLRCASCSSLMPHYPRQTDFDTAKILASVDRLLACSDLIYHVELLGGEPFLHKDLSIIASHLLNSGKILHLDVITNGTLLPPDAVLKSLDHKTLSVVVNDYGLASKKLSALSDSLRRLGIDFQVNRHWAWAELGGFESRRRSPAELESVFAACNFNSCTELLDGRLHRCPRSSHGTKIAVIPEYPEDFIEVLDPALEAGTLAEKLRAFFYEKKFVQACNHCNGNSSESLVLKPGEQPARGGAHE